MLCVGRQRRGHRGQQRRTLASMRAYHGFASIVVVATGVASTLDGHGIWCLEQRAAFGRLIVTLGQMWALAGGICFELYPCANT